MVNLYDTDGRSKIDDIIDKIESWFSYFKENNERGNRLKEFLMGNQWDDEDISYYRRRKKFPLTINKVYSFVMQLIGEQRQMSPQLEITPIYYNEDDDKVSKETEIIEDIVQSIAYNSKTNIVYQKAYKNQLVIGYGAIYVSTEYRNENSFDQEIMLEAIEEPMCCYWDQSAKSQDKSDGDYCGYVSSMSIDEFKKRYPKFDPADAKNICLAENPRNIVWFDDDTIQVADHFYKDWKTKKIYKLNDNTVVDENDLESTLRDKNKKLKLMKQAEILYSMRGQPVNLTNGLDKIEVVDERESTFPVIKHCRVTRSDILEENEWPSKYLPVVFVDGDSYYINGVQYTRPFIQFAEDTQRFINYCATETVSYIRGGRKEKFLATTSNIEKHKNAWKGVDNDNMALLYDPDSRTNQAPIPIPPLEIPQSLLQQYQRAEYDLHTILGRYEAQVGAQGAEVSGVALSNRIRQGNVTALSYPDNLIKGMTQVGKIILDLIPTIYDSYRKIIINDKKGYQRPIEINKKIDKENYENKIERRDYEIKITGGSSFAMQKMEAYAQLMDLIAKIPAFGNVIPDLAAENLELSNASKIVERARKYLIPQIAMQEQGMQLPPPKPDPQEVLMQNMAQSEQKKADASLLSAKSRMIKAEADLRKDFSKQEADKVEAIADVGKANLELQQELIKTENAKLKRENEILKKISGFEK